VILIIIMLIGLGILLVPEIMYKEIEQMETENQNDFRVMCKIKSAWMPYEEELSPEYLTPEQKCPVRNGNASRDTAGVDVRIIGSEVEYNYDYEQDVEAENKMLTALGWTRQMCQLHDAWSSNVTSNVSSNVYDVYSEHSSSLSAVYEAKSHLDLDCFCPKSRSYQVYLLVLTMVILCIPLFILSSIATQNCTAVWHLFATYQVTKSKTSNSNVRCWSTLCL